MAKHVTELQHVGTDGTEDVQRSGARARPWYERNDIPAWRLRLRVLMHEHSTTVRELAVRSGLRERAIHALLQGQDNLTVELAQALALGLRVSPALLVFGVDAEIPSEKAERTRLRRQNMALQPKRRRTPSRVGARPSRQVIAARRLALDEILKRCPRGVSLNMAGELLGLSRGTIYRLTDAKYGEGIGNVLARRIESRLGLGRGKLDAGAPQASVVRALWSRLLEQGAAAKRNARQTAGDAHA